MLDDPEIEILSSVFQAAGAFYSTLLRHRFNPDQMGSEEPTSRKLGSNSRVVARKGQQTEGSLGARAKSKGSDYKSWRSVKKEIPVANKSVQELKPSVRCWFHPHLIRLRDQWQNVLREPTICAILLFLY